MNAARNQALRYAHEQKVSYVCVGDGAMLYAAGAQRGLLKDRLLVSLDGGEPPEELWWICRQGIWRQFEGPRGSGPAALA